MRQSRVVGGVLGAPLTAVLEGGNDAREASDVTRCSGGGGSIESQCDSNVGVVGGNGVQESSTESNFFSMWSQNIESRRDAANSRRCRGREWISKVMSDRVSSIRAAKSKVLREGREKLLVLQRSKEEARKSRADEWMLAHVKLDREWSSPWDRVMSTLPVGEVSVPSGFRGAVGATAGLDISGVGDDARVVGVGYSALCRSSRSCPSFSKPVKEGPSNSVNEHAPSVLPSRVPQFSSFSAFLEDANDDDDLGVEAVDPPTVSVVDDAVQRGLGASCVRLGSLEWEDLKREVPKSLLEGLPGRENSAAAAVWDVLEDIGTGSPGWNRCGAAAARGRFVQSPGVARGGDGDRNREATDALRVFRESLRAKAACLRQNKGHEMCGADDF